MKIFAIRDDAAIQKKDLGYLLYYEKEKRFYIELPEDADEWETPLILSSFVKRGKKTVNSYWSKVWVQQRIVPTDRQNLSQILKDNGLSEYDEYELLRISKGRCAQDDYYLVPMDEKTLPIEINARFEKRLEDVVPLDINTILLFFRDGMVRKCNMASYFQTHAGFEILQKRQDFFEAVRLQIGGHGIAWDEHLMISDSELYGMGEQIPLLLEDFKMFAACRIINAAEAAEILQCSRQYINELVKKGELHPVKASEKSTLFLKSEILKRNWQ